MKAWLRRRARLRRLRRDEDRARERFFRAYFAYQDTAVVFRETSGAWHPTGPIGQAQNEVDTCIRLLKSAQAAHRRVRQIGRTA